MNETCECGSDQFRLASDGRIVCAGYGCGTEFGTWVADDRFALVVNWPPRFGRRQPA